MDEEGLMRVYRRCIHKIFKRNKSKKEKRGEIEKEFGFTNINIEGEKTVHILTNQITHVVNILACI